MKNLIFIFALLFTFGASAQSYVKLETNKPYSTSTMKVGDRSSVQFVNVNTPAIVYANNNVSAISEVSYYNNQNTKIEYTFVGIHVVKLDPSTSDVLEAWNTVNYCTYTVNSKRSKINFIERSPSGKILKNWSYDIIEHTEDDTVDEYLIEKGDNVYFEIVMWKDKSMVALEGDDAIYLISGEFQSTL